MSVKIGRAAAVALAMLLGAGAAHAGSMDVVVPASKADVKSTVTLPTQVVCTQMWAFDVKLAQKPSVSSVKIVQTGLVWGGRVTVSEFKPARPVAPFTRYFLHETPTTHRVSWALGAVFYATPELANEASGKLAKWYSDALKLPSQVLAQNIYVIKNEALRLTVQAAGSAVRVSCEHAPTQNDSILETMQAAQLRAKSAAPAGAKPAVPGTAAPATMPKTGATAPVSPTPKPAAPTPAVQAPKPAVPASPAVPATPATTPAAPATTPAKP